MGNITAQDNGTLAREIYAAFSKGDYDTVLAHTNEDVVAVLTPFGQTFNGKEGFMQFMQGFKGAMPDIEIVVTNQIVTDNTVTTEFIAKGTNTGPLQTPAGPIPPTGKVAEWPVCEVWEVRDGKLSALRNYQDIATMLRQLGLVS